MSFGQSSIRTTWKLPESEPRPTSDTNQTSRRQTSTGGSRPGLTSRCFFARGRGTRSSRCKGEEKCAVTLTPQLSASEPSCRRAGSRSLAPSRYEKKPRHVFSKLPLAVSFGTSDVRVNSETNYTLRGEEYSPFQTDGGVGRRSTR